ncbi:septum site-determining protein Ssd [Bailinhaonella thermotolerans]|uniref:Chromosome partitioning protein n=1 Tax=Bailinhaonella thermotolerans TaxID=1070861 RepID=A0A3A4AMT0_9ACTN|nr:septum site-determining protein Ssd [Bailinhaonella thermotolerans]RJL20411.1 chromosome partitioning protein [Bailinhaonella thermotolerans]
MPAHPAPVQPGRSAVPGRPLLITADHELLDDLLRLAAAADVEVDVAHAPGHARPRWLTAPLVVVGADMAEAMASAGPPSRPGVLLVGTGPAPPDFWRRCVALGAGGALVLPDAERELVDRFAEATEPAGASAAVICVTGGRGGAGASVLSAALALTSAGQGRTTLLVDADPLGGGIDVLLGEEAAPGSRWPDFAEREGRVSCAALREALPARGSLAVLSWDRRTPAEVRPEAMRAVLSAGVRGCDLVVVDLPRRLDPAAAEAVCRATTTLLVVPAEVRAVIAATRVLEALRAHTGDVRAVLREGEGPGLDTEVVTHSLGVPMAGRLPAEPALAAALERGDPPGRDLRGPLARFCRRFLADLGLPDPS